jgi:hypothetical protein
MRLPGKTAPITRGSSGNELATARQLRWEHGGEDGSSGTS